MGKTNFILVALAVLGVAVTTAYVANELSSEGTVEIQEPENDTSGNEASTSTEDEPVDVAFQDGSESRTADFHGASVEPGDAVTDSFTISNNHEEGLTVEFESCAGYPATYSVGPNESEASEISGNTIEPPVNEDIFVEAEIEIPEDAELGEQDLCTDVTATPS